MFRRSHLVTTRMIKLSQSQTDETTTTKNSIRAVSVDTMMKDNRIIIGKTNITIANKNMTTKMVVTAETSVEETELISNKIKLTRILISANITSTTIFSMRLSLRRKSLLTNSRFIYSWTIKTKNVTMKKTAKIQSHQCRTEKSTFK